MRFTRPKTEDPGIGITPLIDIVFLLLIFFMLTSHFNLTAGVDINLPSATQKVRKGETHKFSLVVDREGRTYLGRQEIRLDELEQRLKNMVDKEGLINLVLHADREVQHGRVVSVMDRAQRAGVPAITIAATWNPEEGE